jgi:hypothetical protein
MLPSTTYKVLVLINKHTPDAYRLPRICERLTIEGLVRPLSDRNPKKDYGLTNSGQGVSLGLQTRKVREVNK